jgi:hypothetical protein
MYRFAIAYGLATTDPPEHFSPLVATKPCAQQLVQIASSELMALIRPIQSYEGEKSPSPAPF